MEIAEIIDKQLVAYNKRNLEDFVSLYSKNVEIFNFAQQTPFIRGIVDLKGVYKDVFESSPNLKATIKNRIVFDNKVIDEEEVVGRKGIEYINVVVIYEINNDLITRVTFIRKK